MSEKGECSKAVQGSPQRGSGKCARPKKGDRGRKAIVKEKKPLKAPVAVSVPVKSNYLFSKGVLYRVGDVISVVDHQQGVYYAQIRGLLQDQYCMKSAVLTWLLPTQGSPRDRFDPDTYILGPEEDIPRELDCMEFVCHAPSDYFHAKYSPYPTTPSPWKAECGYIWTSQGPKVVQLPYESQSSDED